MDNIVTFTGKPDAKLAIIRPRVRKASTTMIDALAAVSKADPIPANSNNLGDLVCLAEILTIHRSAREHVSTWHGWILQRHQNDRYQTTSNLLFLHMAEGLVHELSTLAALKIFETADLIKVAMALENAADVLAETISKLNNLQGGK